MSILTKDEFRAIAQRKYGNIQLRGFVNENRIFNKATATTSIFLSHSHYDKEVIEQAKVFFENLGVNVYVDWADKTLPEKTDAETAKRIKNQIMI